MLTPVSIRLFILITALLATGCAGLGPYAEPPWVTLNAIQPLDMTLFEQRYRLRLRIQNPNETDLKVSGMSYTVYLNDREFAQGVNGEDFTVPGYGERLVEVEVTSTLFDILEQLRRKQDLPRERVTWRITGKLSLAGRPGRLPFEYSGQLDLAAPPRGDGV